MIKVYRRYAFRVLKKFRHLFGRKRLTMRFLDANYYHDKQFYLLPFDGKKEVVYDPFGEYLERVLREKASKGAP